MIRAAFLLLAIALADPSPAFDDTALEAILEAQRAEKRMPGLRAAVRLPDSRIIQAAVGTADKASSQALDHTIGMPGGSTGKTFVALLTLLLAERGQLSLDDPVSRWLGDHQWFQALPNADSMTIRHLLSHSSGLKDYPGTMAFQRKMVWRVLRQGSAYFTPEELISLVAGKKPLNPAGRGYRYTDAGYLVLGRALEAAAGKPYYQLLQEEILDPLQLKDIHPQVESALPDIAWSDSLKRDGRMKYDPRSEWTGGGLITTPTMLVRFYSALVLKWPELLRQMIEGGWQNPDEPDWHYGYGLFVRNDGSSFGHGGRWSGYRSHVAHYSHRGLTIAVQTNRDGRVDLPGLVARIEAAIPAVGDLPETYLRHLPRRESG